jgi:hypothetical protein
MRNFATMPTRRPITIAQMMLMVSPFAVFGFLQQVTVAERPVQVCWRHPIPA